MALAMTCCVLMLAVSELDIIVLFKRFKLDKNALTYLSN